MGPVLHNLCFHLWWSSRFYRCGQTSQENIQISYGHSVHLISHTGLIVLFLIYILTFRLVNANMLEYTSIPTVGPVAQISCWVTGALAGDLLVNVNKTQTHETAHLNSVATLFSTVSTCLLFHYLTYGLLRFGGAGYKIGILLSFIYTLFK